MKNIVLSSKWLIAFSLVVLLTTGCKKDEGISATAADIVGTWNMEVSSFDAAIDGKSMVDYLVETGYYTKETAQVFINLILSEILAESTGVIEFKADGTYTFTSEDNDSYSGTWQLDSDGKKVLMDEGTEFETLVTIKSLSSTKIVAESSDKEYYDIDLDNNNEEMTVTMELTLTK